MVRPCDGLRSDLAPGVVDVAHELGVVVDLPREEALALLPPPMRMMMMMMVVVVVVVVVVVMKIVIS